MRGRNQFNLISIRVIIGGIIATDENDIQEDHFDPRNILRWICNDEACICGRMPDWGPQYIRSPLEQLDSGRADGYGWG